MTYQELATFANYALYSAMGVLTLAMLAYAGYLAGLMPARSERREAARERSLVGAAAGGTAATEIGTETETGTGTGIRIEAGAGSGSALAEGRPSRVSGRGPVDVDRDQGVSAGARKLGGIAITLTWLSTGLLGLSVLLRGLSVQRAPLGNLFEFAVTACLAALIAFAVWSTRRDLRWLGLFVVTPVLLVLGVALVSWYTEAAELMPSLQSYWLVIHVTVAVLASAVFFIGAMTGILYLWQDSVERSGATSVLNRFPPSRTLERLTYGLHVVAFPLWTFTLIAGAIWARQAWASYWNWDPKEVWTFIIWVVYAAYLHARVTSGWSKQRATWIALAGFVCIIINYTVVNLFFVGQHSYSGL
ncbi:MAG: c-type cytochrome biogenesis protein CcsB [Dermatophilaceae bacterium]